MRILLSLFFIWTLLGAHSRTNLPKDSIDNMIGQMIMIGIGDFNQANSNEPIFKEIATGLVGGVVLYEKNILPTAPKSELSLLVENLQKNSPTPLFVSIDEEGGKVTRMKTKYGFPKNVSADYLGDLKNLDSTRYYANQTVSILDSFGINMNYAPVLDVNINTENPVIGKLNRSYSGDYNEVIKQSYEVIAQHNAAGLVPVLKHFPGHGSSRNDTHLGLADVTDTWQFEEIYPYTALIDSGVVKAIMTAHIVNRTLDASKKPATLSEKVITGILRDYLGFDGLIISDDMQMGAINNEYGLKEAIRLSIEAGVDVLMFANNVPNYEMVSATTVHKIIKELINEGAISKERIMESYDRIMKLKTEIGLMEESYFKQLKKKLRTFR